MTPADISAIIVTRGDVDMTPIVESLTPVGFHEILIWTNGQSLVRLHPGLYVERLEAPVPDYAVFGRYAAMRRAEKDLIYVQDDDCLIDAAKLIRLVAQYRPDQYVIANMPVSRWADYPDSCLVGWGSVFHRDLFIGALGKFAVGLGDGTMTISERSLQITQSREFLRDPDVVFTVLIPHVKVDIGFQHLPWAEDPARAMFLEPGRQKQRDAMYALAREARDNRKDS